jgi:asparagine synthase (glutamine-hydrolysing)
MNEAELASRFEEATWHCEHHNPDLNYVGKFALSELPRSLGFKVVLTGEGADEHFAGYPMYLPDYLREPDLSWSTTQQPAPEERQRLCAEKDHEAESYYNSIGADGSNRGPSIPRRMLNNITTVCSMTAFTPSSLLAPWTQACFGASDPQQTIAQNIDGRTRDKITGQAYPAWHPLNSAMYVWTKGHLANIFLSCLGDRTEMAHSLEARTPFLDHHLTQYVNGLPPSVKIRYQPTDPSTEASGNVGGRFIEKWILREAAKPFITDELYNRTKHVCQFIFPLSPSLVTFL